MVASASLLAFLARHSVDVDARSSATAGFPGEHGLGKSTSMLPGHQIKVVVELVGDDQVIRGPARWPSQERGGSSGGLVGFIFVGSLGILGA